MPKQYGQACPVAKSLEFLGERWTLLIVRDLLRGPKKFQDVQASLAGVTPGVLSHRLKVLEESGVIVRRLYSEHPPRAEYALTPRGEELRPIVRAMAIWGAKHLDAGLVLVHNACETPIEMAYYCPSCETEIEWTESSYRTKKAKAGRAGKAGKAGKTDNGDRAGRTLVRPQRRDGVDAARAPGR